MTTHSFNATPRKPFLSMRKIGGLYHWRIGRTGGSIYRPKPLLACMAVLTATALQSCSPAQTGNYIIVVTSQAGNEYVMDYGLTAQDCSASIGTGAAFPDGICLQDGE